MSWVVNFNWRSTQVSSTYVTEALRELQRNERDRQTLDQGLLTPQAIRKAQQALQEFERTEDPAKVAERISGLQGQMAQSPHAGRREQYENVLRSITDSRGLLLSASLASGFPSNINLKTTETSPVGRAVRQNLNEALGWITSQGSNFDVSPTIDMVIQADSFFAAGNNGLGNRLLNRARSMLDYATGNSRIQSYNTQVQLPEAAKRYGPVSVSSYETYQNVKAGNTLAAIPLSSFNDETYFLSAAAMNRLQDKNKTLESFNSSLDILYSVSDFLTGVARGVGEGAVDTLIGLMMLSSPQGQATAAKQLAIAMTQLPQIAEELYKRAFKVIEEFPGYSAERRGEIVGRIVFEVAGIVVTRGFGRPGIAVAEVAESKSP